MTGTAPTVVLAAGKPAYLDGDPYVVTVTVTDPDDRTDVVHGTNTAGVPTTVTAVTKDTAAITSAYFPYSETHETVTGMTVTGVARYGSGPLQVTVTDAEGNQATRSIDLNVSSRTLVGFDVAPAAGETVAAAITRGSALLPGAGYVRVYDTPAQGLSNAMPGGKTMLALPKGAVPHVSFKATPTPALLKPWFDALTGKTFLTDHHEDDTGDSSDVPVAQYQADWAALRAYRDVHPNGDLVVLVEILTDYAESHGKGPASKWWTGHADMLGYDIYNASTTAYPEPAIVFAGVIAAAKQFGVPWMVPEFGSKLVAGDTGPGRAAWITACVAYARAHDCVAIAWWMTGGDDLTHDPASLAAWQQAIRG